MYHQIAAWLREQINAGTYASGRRIPAETELVDRFGVARNTVREAITVLIREGRVERRHGHGTFVRDPSAEVLVQLHPGDHAIATTVTVLRVGGGIEQYAGAARIEAAGGR